MPQIHSAKKLTHSDYLNLYRLDASTRSGLEIPYYVASRSKDAAGLKAVSGQREADGVIVYGVYGEEKDRLVLVRQYRYPVGDYVYEFPAGLAEPGEDLTQAGIRELYEETGLTLVPRAAGDYSRPFFTSAGLTDESCAMLFGYCSGTPSTAHQEDTEDIQVVLADRAECRRILKEENVALMCAYMMMHFIVSGGDPLDFLGG